MTNVIELQNVRKVFGRGDSQTIALNDVSLAIPKGQFVAIMGQSGSGKSTLMNIIGLLDVPTKGEYRLDEKLIKKQKDSALAVIRRDKIGFIFQSFNLLPRLTVQQNVELPMIYSGTSKRVRLERAKELLGMVGLINKLKSRPNQLSGGQVQRVAIARSLANKPSLILADEPTGNLDTKSSQAVMETLAQLHKEGATIVMVTHNPELAEYAERIIELRDGSILRDSLHKTQESKKQATKRRMI